jgi:3-polyprenyl-4-hydroxybenzoate decarboxylase
MVPGKHGAIQYDKYMKAGKPFPVAIVLGADPLGYLISGIEVPFGMCEYNYIGAILGRAGGGGAGSSPGCRFPPGGDRARRLGASRRRAQRGPFGEFHGYYPGKAAQGAGGHDRARLLPQRSRSWSAARPPSRRTTIRIRRR